MDLLLSPRLMEQILHKMQRCDLGQFISHCSMFCFPSSVSRHSGTYVQCLLRTFQGMGRNRSNEEAGIEAWKIGFWKWDGERGRGGGIEE